MSIISDIKAASLTARKARETNKATSLITLFSEASMIGKNDGNRETSDPETISVIKKFIKNIDETLSRIDQGSQAAEALVSEKNLISTFLPKQLNEVEIKDILTEILNTNGFDSAQKPMGEMLKILKLKHEGQYDGALAAKIAKEITA